VGVPVAFVLKDLSTDFNRRAQNLVSLDLPGS